MLINEIQAEYAALSLGPEEFPWGMMSYCRVLRRGSRGAFVLIVDEGQLRFSYELRNGRPYFTDVTIKELE